MTSPPPIRNGAWGCLIVPIVIAFVLWALWPSESERRNWADMRARAEMRDE